MVYMLSSCSKRVQSRLALYHGVRALYINFTNDAEETFCNALSVLQVLFLCLNFYTNLFSLFKPFCFLYCLTCRVPRVDH